jgi:hypothetical protein
MTHEHERPADPSTHATGKTQEYYIYLEELRDSGVTNMWGASSYLEEEFDLGRKDARAIHLAWIKAFMEDPKQ